LEKRASMRCSANGMPLTFRSKNVINAGCVFVKVSAYVRESTKHVWK
jgi:hypothetical protein